VHGEMTTMCRVVLEKPDGNRPLKGPGAWIGGEGLLIQIGIL
jgi:hypothetical protein